ncbi:MAG: ABC transporter ATP-binding protein [Crocinitomicaceae bacterium]
MLRIKNIHLTYDRPILRTVNLSVKRGELLGLVGKSGAGKSSLLKIMAGILAPNEGSLTWNGQEMPISSELLIPGYKNISIVNQDFKLDNYHTTEENIRESILGYPFAKREKRIKELIKLLQLQHVAQTKAALLSGGEKQRLSIARAIAHAPDVLLLDEPFGHLDTILKQRLAEVIMKLKFRENLAIILVSHDPQDILGLCDNVTFLRKGKLSKNRKPQEIYYQLKNKEIAKLFGPVNEINVENNTHFFRPDEFETSEKDGIQVYFQYAMFSGGFYQSYMLCEQKMIVLYANYPLNEIRFIRIRRKFAI